MATRQPFTWLVVTSMPERNGCETAPLARASYDAPGDLLTVTGPGGQRDVAQVGGHPMQPLAKLMLQQLFKKEQRGAA